MAGDVAAADWLLAGVWLRLLTCGFCVASTELTSAGAVWLVTGVPCAGYLRQAASRLSALAVACRLPYVFSPSPPLKTLLFADDEARETG